MPVTHDHEMSRYAPESEVEDCWRDFWAAICAPGGTLDVEQVKKELHDYHGMLQEVPRVFVHVSGAPTK